MFVSYSIVRHNLQQPKGLCLNNWLVVSINILWLHFPDFSSTIAKCIQDLSLRVLHLLRLSICQNNEV